MEIADEVVAMSASLAAGERDAGARPDDNGDEQEGSAHEIIEVGDDDEEEDAEDGAQNDEDADDDAAVDDVEADSVSGQIFIQKMHMVHATLTVICFIFFKL
jgi:hypothetical protein